MVKIIASPIDDSSIIFNNEVTFMGTPFILISIFRNRAIFFTSGTS